MTRVSTAAVALTALLIFSTGAKAAPIAPLYDFSTFSSGPVTILVPPTTFVGNITASAYYFDIGLDSWEASTLIARDQDNDHGLGNCSPTEPCNGEGDNNELSQLTNTEAILLEKLNPNDAWAGFWVSSLDGNGDANGPENGTLYWGDTDDIDALLTGGNSFAFTYPAFGDSLVEGNLGLPPGPSFDIFARYVVFVPGSGTADKGANNDYLLWGVDLREGREVGDPSPVPEPASLVLLGSGLIALARKRRRDGRR